MENSAGQQKKGFFYGYIIVILGFFVNMVIGGTMYTFSVFFEPLSSDFGWSRAATSGAFSLYMLLHGFLYIFTGRLNDKFGPRIVLSACGLIMGSGYVLMSLTTEIWHIYLFYGVILAIGMSGGYVPLTSTVTRWFVGHKKRGMMVGMSVAGVGAGTMLYPPLATWLISEYGWQTSYVVIGVLSGAIIMSCAQFLKRAPEQIVHNESDGSSIDRQQQGFTLRQAVRTRQFWLLSGSFFGFGYLLQAVMVHIAIHMTGLGISSATAATVFLVIGASSIAARISMGTTADKIGDRLIIIAGLTLMGLAVTGLFFAREMWAFYLFAIAFGAGYGGLVSSQSPIVADLFGMRSHGIILGVIVSLITFGSAIGPTVAGAIFDNSGSYNVSFAICVGFAIAGIVLAFFIKPVSGGKV